MPAVALSISFCVALLAAGADTVTTGPKVGEKAPSLKIAAHSSGTFNVEEVSPPADDQPTIYLFVRADLFNRPTYRFIKQLDERVSEEKSPVRVVAVWLTDNVDQAKAYLPKVDVTARFERTKFGVYDGKRTGPPEWMLHIEAPLSVVVVQHGKVTSTIGYRQSSDAAVREVWQKVMTTNAKK